MASEHETSAYTTPSELISRIVYVDQDVRERSDFHALWARLREGRHNILIGDAQCCGLPPVLKLHSNRIDGDTINVYWRSDSQQSSNHLHSQMSLKRYYAFAKNGLLGKGSYGYVIHVKVSDTHLTEVQECAAKVRYASLLLPIYNMYVLFQGVSAQVFCPLGVSHALKGMTNLVCVLPMFVLIPCPSGHEQIGIYTGGA